MNDYALMEMHRLRTEKFNNRPHTVQRALEEIVSEYKKAHQRRRKARR